jgi:uncharacterized protein (TIGR02421 family)
MMPASAHEIDAAYASVTAVVRDRLSRNLPIRRNLPGDGRVRIDRQLPFLCVYRAPPGGSDAGTRELVTTEAAYLFASGEPAHAGGLGALVQEIAATMREHFGAFLLMEIWAEDDRVAGGAPRDATRPGFRIVAEQASDLEPTIGALQAGLREIHSHGWTADVAVDREREPAPSGGKPLPIGDAGRHTLGLAVRPVYRDAQTGAVFPVVLRSLRRQLAVALRKAVFAFAGLQAPDPLSDAGRANGQRLTHYESLGPSALVKAARLVDQQLSETSQAFDFVLQTVPLNSASAWAEFQARGYTGAPTFYYRPLPYDPALVKRQLFEIPVDRIEDATLIHLFAEKQDHLDRQLTALKNIDAPPFFYDSIQLYGIPDAALVALAQAILVRLPRPEETPANNETIRAEELVAAARDQIDFYHQRLPGFAPTVQLRNDLAATMMVAKDQLLVSGSAALARPAVEPLLHHEIGTHLVTYFNGRQQPFQQLYAGLAGYEELQEGLAVLAEFLTGGLTASRLRTIACRVLAVQAMVERQPFVDTFHLLHDEHRLPARTAFMTTLRAYRGGGLTKDAIYLRGLRNLVDYLREGHDAEPLYVGKIALGHVPLVRELRRRGIVGPPALLPRFWDDAEATRRLDLCRRSSLLELVEHP